MELSPIETMLVAGFFGLFIRVIFTWYQDSRRSKNSGHCEDHKDCMLRIDECERCISNMKTNQDSLKVLFEERTKNIMLEIQKGNEVNETQRKDISDIKQGLAGLTAVMKKGFGA